MQCLQGVRRSGLTALTAAALMLWAYGAPRAAPLDLSTKPLFLKTGVKPNIVVTLDDSGSMDRHYIPDNLPENEDYNELYFFSAHYNGIAYDPNVTYTPPVDAAGNSLTTTCNAAWDDGFARQNQDDLTYQYLDFDVDERGGSAMQGTTLEERMAGNLRDQTLAFAAAEAALATVEEQIAGWDEAPIPASSSCGTPCVWQPGILDPYDPSQTWDTTAVDTLAGLGATGGTDAAQSILQTTYARKF